MRAPELSFKAEERSFPATAYAAAVDNAVVPEALVESRSRLLAIAVTTIVGSGFLLRLFAALHLSPHVDEASSILAAHAVAGHGLPVLPSGTAYLQGATLSYLLFPLVWLGWGGLDSLAVMRLVLVLAGTIAVYLCYRLGRYVTGEEWVGMGMALLVALDPISVQWSGHVRMYALLQAITVGLAWAFIQFLINGGPWRRGGIVVALFWAAVFTHVGAALLLPAMALSSLLVYRRSLLRQSSLLVVLALCTVAPPVLLVLNQVLGSASVDSGEEASIPPFISFVGDNLISPLARFGVSPLDWEWEALIRSSTLFWLLPGLLVAVATLIGARVYLGEGRLSLCPERRIAVITLLSFYWLPVFVVGVFTVSPKERYLLNVHTLGYFFVAATLFELSRWRIGLWPAMGSILTVGLTAIVLTPIAGGLFWRLQHSVIHPDYNAAIAYVASHHMAGQPVILALPAVGYLGMDSSDRDDMYFLAGSQNRPRAERYTRHGEDGRLIDYWIGADAIVSAESLRQMLVENPDLLLVVDQDRIEADWAYGGAIQEVIEEMTTPVFTARGGALVLLPSEGIEAMESGGP